MKQLLNPDLVKHKPCDSNWVFLRDLKTIAGYTEVGIGSIEVEIVPETAAEKEALIQQLKETDAVLSTLAGEKPDGVTHLFLTSDCFGISGPVRLLIFSTKPFASKAA